MTYGTDEEEVFMGRDFGRTRNYSDEVAALIDEEMKALIDEAYKAALNILDEQKAVLHALAKALLEKETVSSDEFEETVVGDLSPRGEMLAQYEPPKKYLSISEALRLQYASWKGVRHRVKGANKRRVSRWTPA